jgi:anti-sigma regulatory factor (Ser/Thr protein kinase)
MDVLNISRVGANNYIKQLEERGWIARSGPSTRPIFSPGYQRCVSKLYEINNLEEDIAWAKDFRPYFSLAPNILNIVNHGFTEMLNNAIDHSGGDEVFIWARQNEARFTLAISDNGVGIFAKIAAALKLPDMRQALFELSKGKFTTDPSKHSGEGVFFTSRMFDWFEINANNLEFHHDKKLEEDIFHEAKGIFPNGTVVFMSIALDSKRTAADIYAEYTNAPDDFDFSRTVVPMKLAQYGEEHLVSRSQAKRLIARFDRFKKVVLNFDEVQEIGQAFADEIFRVYANEHPDVELIPEKMTKQVQSMWLRAVAPRA